MTTITLPADIEASLAEEARRRGTTPEAVALDSLRKLFDRMFTDGRDHVWTIDAVAESPGVAMAEWTFEFVVSDAVPRSAGRRLRFRGVSVFELRDGRCGAYREYFDRGVALVELGFEPDSLWRTLGRRPETLPG